MHVKKSNLSKKNYSSISILLNVSQICERCSYDQIATHFEHIFARYQCGFSKGHNAQHWFLATVEKWKKLDDGGAFGALLTDLSKVIDYIQQSLLN